MNRLAFVEEAPLKPPHVRLLVGQLMARLGELDNEQIAALSMALDVEHTNRLATLFGHDEPIPDEVF